MRLRACREFERALQESERRRSAKDECLAINAPWLLKSPLQARGKRVTRGEGGEE